MGGWVGEGVIRWSPSAWASVQQLISSVEKCKCTRQIISECNYSGVGEGDAFGVVGLGGLW